MKNLSDIGYDEFVGDFENYLHNATESNNHVLVRSAEVNRSFLILPIDKAKELIPEDKLKESNIKL